MIQAASLLTLSSSLPRGAARQPSGGAFALPGEDGEENAGQPGDAAATLLDGDTGGERQGDAATGNGLPAAPIDPWLMATMLAPEPTSTTPAGAAAIPASGAPRRSPTADIPVVAAVTGAAAMRSPPPPAPDVASNDAPLAPPFPAANRVGPPVLPALPTATVNAATTPMAASATLVRPTMPKTTRSPAPSLAVDQPVSLPAETTTDVPASGRAARPVASRTREEPDAAPTPSDALSSPIRPGGDDGRRMTIVAPSLASPAAIPVVEVPSLPTAALATSALTPVRRGEIAAVATRVDAVAGAPASVRAAQRGESVRADAVALPRTTAIKAVFTQPPPSIAPNLTTSQDTPTNTLPSLAPPVATATVDPVEIPSTAPRRSPREVSTAIIPSNPPTAPAASSIIAAPPVVTLPLGWTLRTTTTDQPATSAAARSSAAAPTTAPSASIVAATVRSSAAVPTVTSSASTAAAAVPTIQPPRPAGIIATDLAAASPVVSAPIAVLPAAAATAADDLAGRSAQPFLQSPLTSPASARPRDAAPVASTAPPANVALPLAPPAPASPTPAASSVVFGAARFAAQQAERRDDPLTPTGSGIAAALSPPQSPVAVPATAAAPLDVRHERWPHAMVERIEMIRDAVDAVDTRIRLVPDALGPIDVTLTRDGDTVHVHLAAEQPQTRALVQDAAPRLAEAAEQRGLKLGRMEVGADAGTLGQQASSQGQGQGQNQGQRPQPAVVPPRTPRSPVVEAASADDTRIA